MNKLKMLYTAALLSASPFLYAPPWPEPTVPEMDAGVAVLALGLILGIAALIRDR